MVTDTIVALATPPGRGAVAMVRLSGTRAVEIASRLAGATPSDWSPRTATLCTLRSTESSADLDQVLVTVFPGPGSYTGEDVVEISTHGGYLIPRSVVAACLELGARDAEAGEFTQRAFLNGKLDLTQAEAVQDLVSATAPKAAAVALHQLERGLGERVSRLREQVVGLEALLVQHLDFPEEDEGPVPLTRIGSEARGVSLLIQALVATAPSGELLRDGVLTVLAGPPNSGKSSLFNALIGRDRAIVTELPGTTRDALEAPVSIAGYPFRLVDTAGIREDAGTVERLGIEVAERYLSRADLVLYCREVTEALSDVEEAFVRGLGATTILVRTKGDLGPTMIEAPDGASPLGLLPSIPVSVKSGVGLARLTDEMKALAFGGVVENRGDVPVVTNDRQRRLLESAGREVGAFARALGEGVPPEVAQAHLKTAESALEDVLGLVSTDDVLDRVFRDFCIGK